MSRTASPHWKLALPLLGLAAMAAFAVPTQAAADGKARAVRVAAADEPYALVRDTSGSFDISGSSDDWDDVRAAQRAIDGEFIWFREGGRSYVIQDPETIKRARAAWAPLDRLGELMKVHGKEMEKHGKKMEVLGRDMERAAAKPANMPSERDMREVDDGMQALSKHMDLLSRQMAAARDDAERRIIQQKMAETGKRMSDAGERIGEAYNGPQARQQRASMEDIGRQMEIANQPMEKLGKRMGELGKEMERESKAADKTVRALIKDARMKGLAKPVPTAS
ncbi:hypothetical protein SOM61_22710 [Massilia sp. CFBP9012]|uniref:hypothetical protein n=1 Tax=Massilia sp. CFBP9012 TaxID=3096531 RepID=UPI002A6B89E7|nr:hypothetical protein [Massilia sp. CFBP9012]MDY0977779.1 hypothetical protein [Massilia sp. CFBP9012]